MTPELSNALGCLVNSLDSTALGLHLASEAEMALSCGYNKSEVPCDLRVAKKNGCMASSAQLDRS